MAEKTVNLDIIAAKKLWHSVKKWITIAGLERYSNGKKTNLCPWGVL